MTVPCAKPCGGQHAHPPVVDGRDGVSPSGESVGNMSTLPRRKHPVHGVFMSSGAPTIVLLTVCTENKEPWLACATVHSALVDVWKAADAWLVGYYLLMPDHIHLFCSPYKLEFALKTWVSHWKRKFSCLHLPEAGSWQRDYWDTRLRREENYQNKWEYIRQNPVEKMLVTNVEDWSYQGVLNELRW